MNRKVRALLGLALAVGLAAAACSPSDGGDDRADTGGASATGGARAATTGGARATGGVGTGGATAATGGGASAGGPQGGSVGTGGGASGGSGSGGISGASGGDRIGGGGGGGRGSEAGGPGGSRGGGGGMTASGGRGGSPEIVGPFDCNQVTGGQLAQEWFKAGFENVVDNSHWQVKWRVDGYLEQWANPDSPFWNATVDSTCTRGSSAPDRVVFAVLSFSIKSQADYRRQITSAINNFKTKYPTVRRIDLVTQIAGPGNRACPAAPLAGEGIVIPVELDAAMAEVAAAFPSFVSVAPHVEADSCADFQGGGPHLTTAGNTAAAKKMASYFQSRQ